MLLPPSSTDGMEQPAPHRDTAFFDYDLPPERIAQEPLAERDQAKLLIDRGRAVDHRRVSDLVDELHPGDVLVVNNTKVSRARLQLSKPTGGQVEVLLLEPTGAHRQWQALVRGGRRVRPGTVLSGAGEPIVIVGEALDDGRRLVEVVADDAMERLGQVPLPPYIRTELEDQDRYQTVFADQPGSVAAPTAGLHLTDLLLTTIREKGVDVVEVELRVGLGTFRPITAEHVDEHHMHAETYRVTEAAWQRIREANRVVAVGTTVVRALESVAAGGRLSDSTELFISRGFDWQVVDTLMTNFHVPRSSLLVLVDAFVGSRWTDLYRIALDSDYRFLSFGDAMLIDRRHPGQW